MYIILYNYLNIYYILNMFKTLFEFVNKNIISYCFDIKTNYDYDKETEYLINKYNIKNKSTSYDKNPDYEYLIDKNNIKNSCSSYNKKLKSKYNENAKISSNFYKQKNNDYDKKKYDDDNNDNNYNDNNDDNDDIYYINTNDNKNNITLSCNNSSCDFEELNERKLSLSSNIDIDYDIISYND